MILLKNVSHWWENGEISHKGIHLEVNEGEFILISGKNAIACFSGFTLLFVLIKYFASKLKRACPFRLEAMKSTIH